VVRWHYRLQASGYAALLCGVLAVIAPATAQAGFFDLLFGPSQDQPPPAPQSYAEPAPVMPAPLGPQSVRQSNGDTGHGVAYCVRLCDGLHFPLEHVTNATPVETCRAMCPASKTKVFFGSEIGASVAKDGARYADLDTAFIYRKQLVANCTCNGKDAFGLAPFDLSHDPTLRPGDMIATKDGIVAYSGKNGSAGIFTPVDQRAVEIELNPAFSGVKVTKRNEAPLAEVDDDPGTIASSASAPPPVDISAANIRGPVSR
jgi:hypothetical protein